MSANKTLLVAEFHPDYGYFMADVWVGVVLTLLVLSCVCCVGSCLLYHKLQQWKQRVVASGAGVDMESLPSYTIVSGLPTYEEALQQLRCAREPPRPQPLSVLELLQLYETARSRPTKSNSSHGKAAHHQSAVSALEDVTWEHEKNHDQWGNY